MDGPDEPCLARGERKGFEAADPFLSDTKGLFDGLEGVEWVVSVEAEPSIWGVILSFPDFGFGLVNIGERKGFARARWEATADWGVWR